MYKEKKKGEAFCNWRLEPDYLTTFCLSLFPIRQFLWRLERTKPGSRVQVVQLGRTSEVISSKIHIVRDKKNQCSRKLKRRILCSLFQMCWKVLSKSKKKIFGISWRQREVLVSLDTVTWLLRTSTPRGENRIIPPGHIFPLPPLWCELITVQRHLTEGLSTDYSWGPGLGYIHLLGEVPFSDWPKGCIAVKWCSVRERSWTWSAWHRVSSQYNWDIILKRDLILKNSALHIYYKLMKLVTN